MAVSWLINGMDPDEQSALDRHLTERIHTKLAPQALVEQLRTFCLDPTNLQNIDAYDAYRALQLLVVNNDQWQRAPEETARCVVNLLRSLDDGNRRGLVKLFRRSSAPTLGALVRQVVQDRGLRAESWALIIRGTATRPARNSTGYLLISDIDDTIKPWKDPSCAAAVYPFLRRLYEALNAGHLGAGIRGDVVFVTARPDLGTFPLLDTKSEVGATGIAHAAISYAPLGAAAGSLVSSMALQASKIRRISELVQRNEDKRIVLLGDSGQTDVAVFQEILRRFPHHVDWAIVHEIPGHPVPPDFERLPRAIVASDYRGVALALHRHGAINFDQLRYILRPGITKWNKLRAFLASTFAVASRAQGGEG
jgi:hypothetical protein